MLEALLTDELLLPRSRLTEFEDVVPLPQFLKMDIPSFQRLKEPAQMENLSHYHFLAQIAHRILVSNIKGSLYCSGELNLCQLLYQVFLTS